MRAGLHPIGISPDDLNHFGVLGNGGNAWFTADGGATLANKVLTALAPGWPGFNATLAYADNQTMYVGNEAAVGTAQRVIKSTDGGNTWAHASAGQSAGGADQQAARQLARSVGQDGVCRRRGSASMRRRTAARTWHLFGTGLPMVNVSDLYMPTDGSYLRVSTYGRGVWEMRF